MKKAHLNNALKAVKAKATDEITSSEGREPGAISSIQSLKQGLDQLASGAPQDIDTALIKDSRVQDRFDVSEDLEDLIKSINKSGQKLPVLLRKTAEPNTYEVVYGRRRIAACKSLGIKVKAYVTRMDEREALISQGLENSARLQRSFIEQAVYASQLLKQTDINISKDDVIEILATDETSISRMLNVVAGIPMAIISKIGPAHDAGRRPWMKLRDALANKEDWAEADVVELIDVSLSSKDRLSDLLNKLHKGSSRPKSVEDPTFISIADGTVNAELRSKRLLIKESSGSRGFAEFVSMKLSDLFEEFSAADVDKKSLTSGQ